MVYNDGISPYIPIFIKNEGGLRAMRQGDGSDLPGVNSPRSADIGIIYVAPNDDRQSVLVAILSQDKLGRKQVVVVLPVQNKAFPRPVDFDGLKNNTKRTLRAQLVFVVPGGSGPAEFARQRGFPVYSSLENYARSVRDGEQSTPANRRGWVSPVSRQKPADASSVTPSDPNNSGQVQPLPNVAEASASAQQGMVQHDPGTLVDAAAIVGASTVIDSGLL